MICARCHRWLFKPAALSGGLPVGPRCAERLGLTAPKSKRLPSLLEPHIVVRVDANQIPLFQTEQVTA